MGNHRAQGTAYPLRTLLLHASTAEHAAHTTAHTTEKLREQVLGGHTTTHATISAQALFTILVVDLALLGIGQNLVTAENMSELISCKRGSRQVDEAAGSRRHTHGRPP